MYQITHVATSKVLGDPCHTEKEAQNIATADKRSRLEKTGRGLYTLKCLGFRLPWKLVEKDYTIIEMVGVWIDADGGRLTPEETTEENELVFIDRNGTKHLGLYDAEEGLFVSDDGTSFIPEKVTEFMILLESIRDSGL